MTDPSGAGAPAVEQTDGSVEADRRPPPVDPGQPAPQSPVAAPGPDSDDREPALAPPSDPPLRWQPASAEAHVSTPPPAVLPTDGSPEAAPGDPTAVLPPDLVTSSPADPIPGTGDATADAPVGGLATAVAAPAEATPVPAPGDGPAEAPPVHLRGGFERFEIGDPGRAFGSVVSRQDRQFPWTPDTVADGVTVEDRDEEARLEVRAASVRGLSHRHASKVRQDQYAFLVTKDRTHLVAVVADGVSAGPRSHMAAEIAAQYGCWTLTRLLATSAIDDIDWLKFLEDLADRMAVRVAQGRAPGSPPPTPHEVAEDMASTIIVGIVDVVPGDDGSHAVHVIRLGDTSGWIIQPDREWVSLGQVKNEGAAIAESATSGLPFVPAEAPPMFTTRLAPGEALVLMTDGIGDPLGAGRGEVGSALADCWATPPAPIEFAAQIDFGRKSFDDDRTAIAVWPIGG